MVNVRLVQGEALVLYGFTNGRFVGLDPGCTTAIEVGKLKRDIEGVGRECGYGVVPPWVPMFGDGEAVLLLLLEGFD